MPFDERKRWKEALDVTSREAQRSHPEHEDTDPPPSDPSWPPAPVVRPGYGSPSATVSNPPPHVRRLGNWGKVIASIVAGGAALYTVGHPVVTWIATRPSSKDLDDTRTYCAGASASAAASAVRPYPQRIDQLERRADGTDERFDWLDDYGEETATKARRPVPPKFGPKAEARGDVRQWKKRK